MRPSLFITGVDGYLGSHLLERLNPSRYGKVVCLTRRSGRTHAAPNVDFCRGDLLEPVTFSTSLAECDTVLHMAAVTGKAAPATYFRVNRDGTATLLEACRKAGVRRFIFISTIAATFRDQSRYYYAQSKCEAEKLVERSGLEYMIVRPTIIMGPGAPVIESLSKLASAPVIPVFGDGTARVQPVSVRDVATFLLESTDDGAGFASGIVEIGGPEIMTIEELLVRIRRIRYGKTARVLHIPAGPVKAVLGAVEKVLLPILPLTSGQLASFTNDGTTNNSSGTLRIGAPRESLHDVLTSA